MEYLQIILLHFLTFIYKIQFYIITNPYFKKFYEYYTYIVGIQYVHIKNIYFINLENDYLIKKIDLHIVRELLKFKEDKIDNQNNYILVEYNLSNTEKYKKGVLNGDYILLVNCKFHNLYILLDYLCNFEYYFKKCMNDENYVIIGETYLQSNFITENNDNIDITHFYNQLLGPDKLYHKFLSFIYNDIMVENLWKIYNIYNCVKDKNDKEKLNKLVLVDYNIEEKTLNINDYI
jgi:hypothetical protein